MVEKIIPQQGNAKVKKGDYVNEKNIDSKEVINHTTKNNSKKVKKTIKKDSKV